MKIFNHLVADAGASLENPCVGGSIPPRATKNIVYATPTHASGRCRFWGPQALAPAHFGTLASHLFTAPGVTESRRLTVPRHCAEHHD